MDKIVFEITADEVRRVAGKKLGRQQIKKVLTVVENDGVLWGDIEQSIRDAVVQINQ